MTLVQQNYWDDSYDKVVLNIAPESDEVRQWIERFFKNSSGRCLEVGCYPGRYLAVFGELGFELNGIDKTPRVATDLPAWLKTRKYNIGTFSQIDFVDSEVNQQYDIVMSFGFIEHFYDWKEVLSKQATLVNDDGYLIVTTPNFKGSVQRLLHSILDKENYDRHHIPAMNIKEWVDIAEELNFEIIFSGTFGKFDFWVDNQKRGFFQQSLLRLINKVMPILRLLPYNRASYAPYCGLIAKKNYQSRSKA